MEEGWSGGKEKTGTCTEGQILFWNLNGVLGDSAYLIPREKKILQAELSGTQAWATSMQPPTPVSNQQPHRAKHTVLSTLCPTNRCIFHTLIADMR